MIWDLIVLDAVQMDPKDSLKYFKISIKEELASEY